jgi:hypothetical protein
VDAPETVSEAVRILQTRGFDDDFAIDAAGVRCSSCGGVHPATALEITDVFRFEGASDPGDEAIVLGVECPSCRKLGIIVSAFGADADDQMLALVEQLARRRD